MSERRKRNRALLLLCAVQFISLADASVVHMALPSMQRSLHAPGHLLHWVVTAYALLCGGFLLLGGRFGDIWGKRRMLLCGVSVFTGAAAAAGLAPSIAALSAARALQGLGAALMLPSVLSLIALLFPDARERHRALGLFAAISSVGFASGLVLGGLLTVMAGWRSVFLITLPAGVAILWLSFRLLPESGKVRQPADLPGAAAITGSLLAFLSALTASDGETGRPAAAFGLLLLSALGFAGFLRAESRAEAPLVPLRLFANRSLACGIAASLVFGAVMGSSVYLVNLYLQNVLGLRPLAAAAVFLPQELLTMAAAGLAARALSGIGLARTLSLGLLAFALGFLLLAFLVRPDSGAWYGVLPGTLCIGFGAAMVLVAGSAAATSEVPPERQGTASGLWNTGPHIGSAVGIAAVTALSGAGGYPAAFAAGAVFAGIGLCGVRLLLRSGRRKASLDLDV